MYKIPKNTKKSSEIFKCSMHNVVSAGTNVTQNMAFFGPIDCVRFAKFSGKMYNRCLFPYEGLTIIECVPEVFACGQ